MKPEKKHKDTVSNLKWLFVLAFLVLSQSFIPGNCPLFAEENSDVKKSFSSVRTIRAEVFEKLPKNVNLPFFKGNPGDTPSHRIQGCGCRRANL